jgi:hypothetical protein
MRKSVLGVFGAVMVTITFTMISWTPIKRDSVQNLAFTTNNVIINQIQQIYDTAHLGQSGLSLSVFTKAATGFYNLKNAGKVSEGKSILSIADFDLKSREKRFWIVDLDQQKLILNTWVAHGTYSGGDQATDFSNTVESQKSSIGFYVTGETYRGKHGLSLRLDGMDEGFNSNARQRAIVVHGANYVSQHSIDLLGRLGRSQGCPAVPQELASTVVNTMEGGTVLFINASIPHYTSQYLGHGWETLASNPASMY